MCSNNIVFFYMNKEDEILIKLEDLKKLAMIQAKELLTVEDVMLYTGLSKGQVYLMSSKKIVPHYKPSPKNLYFKKSDIEAWMQTNRVSSSLECQQKAIDHCL